MSSIARPKISRDRTTKRCESCDGYDMFTHAISAPSGSNIDYVSKCQACGARHHVTGQTDTGGRFTMSGRKLRRWERP